MTRKSRRSGEIAAARALSDLAHQLLSDAAGQIEDITHQRAHPSL
jgi:Rv2632c-like